MSRGIGIGVVGLGSMGSAHIRAYRAAAAAGYSNTLVCVCDPAIARHTGLEQSGNVPTGNPSERLFDPALVRCTTDPQSLFDDDRVELVSICTPTDTHVTLACAALSSGKHVLLEKPVALEPRDIARISDAARASGRLCMPAMCMRFWPGWTWLREAIHDGRYGRLSSLVLTRIGAMPGWSRSFYGDVSRSGGAIVDLHIHDTDFIVWCFGLPRSVRSIGSDRHVTTLYDYAPRQGPEHLAAEGAWTMDPAHGFRMRYRATFAEATVEFDLSSSPTLTVYAEKHGDISHPSLPDGTGYDGEIRHLLSLIRDGHGALGATLDEAFNVARVLKAEIESTQSARAVSIEVAR